LLSLLAAVGASTALASADPSGESLRTAFEEQQEIIVHGRQLEQIGTAQTASEGVVGYADFAAKPISRVGELAENVPGLIATQHSGTGKANQYFLRGFNLDHGTDFAAFVDGVPVNMRSHGHGQGYLDLNFVIPELIERIDYRKGPYHAETGDFSLAGSAAFRTCDRLPQPFVEATVGEYGYYRALAAGSAAVGAGDLLIGLEGTLSNGPWLLDEDLEKVNGLVKLSGDAGRWRVAASVYHANWTSSDQIPLRAVENGRISRFGFIDPDLGGRTTRLSLNGGADLGALSLDAYALHYRFRLTSNFTYFLDDPLNGDEFQQRDRRSVFGASLRHRTETRVGAIRASFRLGVDARYDDVGLVGLYRSSGGIRDETVREDRLDEYSLGLFGEVELALSGTLRAILGVRGEAYGYDVSSTLAANSGRGGDSILLPKASLAWRAGRHAEFYASYGEGFHSNDARGAAIAVDPASGDPADPVPPLVRGRGAEWGARIEYPRFIASLALFRLTIGSELVFVGDAGGTEPSPPSRRQGAEATLFWQPADGLTLDGSASFTRARFRGLGAGADRIPEAVGEVLAGGATVDLGRGISGTVRLRHFGPAPLAEDDSVRSDATTLVNLGAYYGFGAGRIALDLFNLFDARDPDISYFYASRLPGEPAQGVENLHFHPVEPRQLRASLRLLF
jgi:outer membrane receptor protein involved in Fe transport